MLVVAGPGVFGVVELRNSEAFRARNHVLGDSMCEFLNLGTYVPEEDIGGLSADDHDGVDWSLS